MKQHIQDAEKSAIIPSHEHVFLTAGTGNKYVLYK
jgi:hypothetical protein